LTIGVYDARIFLVLENKKKSILLSGENKPRLPLAVFPNRNQWPRVSKACEKEIFFAGMLFFRLFPLSREKDRLNKTY
jgi:hypothetical protein